MKQNERILVYAVTGFLAIILMVAVFFGRDSGEANAAPKSGASPVPQGLGELLGQKAGADGNGTEVGKVAGAGLPQPAQVAPQQPLAAPSKPMIAAELVAQQVGPSRRDRMVRFVRARSGDSLETLVRRWCGARDPFLEEAQQLNEDLVMVRMGQEVAVPWVDDETVLALHEARQPKMLVPEVADGTARTDGGAPVPASAARPGFEEPGGAVSGSGAVGAPATGRPYTVKAGDSLWKIADRTYGRQNADRMVGEIRRLNPGVGANLREGQKLLLPPAASSGKNGGA